RARRRARDEVEHAVAVPPVPTPLDQVSDREDRELLRRALADVPAAHSEVLVLHYMEGQPVADIAAALGISEELVKQRMVRGRRALRESVAARVEAALGRARPGPAFGAGVVAAVSAAGARTSSAASAAGKGIAAVMAKKTMVMAAAAVLAVAG